MLQQPVAEVGGALACKKRGGDMDGAGKQRRNAAFIAVGLWLDYEP